MAFYVYFINTTKLQEKALPQKSEFENGRFCFVNGGTKPIFGIENKVKQQSLSFIFTRTSIEFS